MKIAILGTGITAKAVSQKIKELPNFTEVSAPTEANLVIASPGIAPRDYPKTKAEIISEPEFAFRLFNSEISTYSPILIGITGTNGKTTTTSLLAHILNAPPAGNIGIPLINYINHPKMPPIIIVELSSYQLEQSPTIKPDIAIWLNLSADHLQRHQTLEKYAQAKANIFKHQTSENLFIYPKNDHFIQKHLSQIKSKTLTFSSEDPRIKLFSKIKIKGLHNKINALVCFLVAKSLNIPESEIISKIESFSGLEHRLEHVTNYNNIQIYNDSKSTNPESTIVAINSFSKPINLILCGKDKGLNLNNFIQQLKKPIKNIIIFGEISSRFQDIAFKNNFSIPIHPVFDIQEAISKSFFLSKPKDIILFSPSCSSFDQFQNFEERGKIFKKLVYEYIRK